MGLARRQQGVITRSQLRAAGVGRRQLEHAVAAGRLSPAGGTLYRTDAPPARGERLVVDGRPDPGYVAEARELLLRLGPHARAARATAAVLWGFGMAVEPVLLHADVPRGSRGHRDDACDVRATRDRASVLRRVLPGTSPLRVPPAATTALSCAAELPMAEAVAVLDSAMRAGACTRASLATAVDRRSGRGDVHALRAALRWCDPRAESVLESLLRVLLSTSGLVPPARQLVLVDPATGRRQRADLAWPERRLVVEADGRRFHDVAERAVVDRRRDNVAAVLGWRVLRFTWADVVHRPEAVVAEVRAALAAAA